ncbi:Protein NPC2-like [Exaiptasia diaphana]|nr:Protein NPC2-like [Exaiptasia diaphana]
MKPAIRLALVVIIATVTSIQAMKLKFTDCGSKVGKLVSVDVDQCTSDDPCSLKRGTNVTSTATMIPLEEVTQATIYMHATVSGITIPIDIPNPNACSGHGLSCPLKSGETVELSMVLEVEAKFPRGKVILKTELKDQAKNDIFCNSIPFNLV